MSTAAPLRSSIAKPHSSAGAPRIGLFLQRKCACGAPTASLAGECAECSNSKRLQARLAIGASNDPLEREADLVADQVLAPATRSAPRDGGPTHIQRFSGPAADGMVPAPSSVDQVLASSGKPLEPELRRDMEQRFGHDFAHVRVHSDSSAGQSASNLSAQAYTVGRDIVFGAGRYAPGTRSGQHLLAHELTHVVQQSAPDEQVLRRAPAAEGIEDETEDDPRAEDPADGYEVGADNEVAPDNDTEPGDSVESADATDLADDTGVVAPAPVPLQAATKAPTTGKWILVKLPGTLIRFEGTRRVDSWGISGGRTGHATPTGSNFSIFSRDENHRSSSYGKCDGKPIGPSGDSKCKKQGGTYVGADMHYFQEFASQVGFHRGDPAVQSHGCIHVSGANAKTLWNWSTIGTPVVVCSGPGCNAYLGGSTSKRKSKGKPKALQRRLAIGVADDPLERQADRAADRVMAMPSHALSSSAQRQIQRFSGQSDSGLIAGPDSVDHVLASPGRPLEPTLRRDMEQRFRYDFSRVLVHDGPAAQQSARDVSALAYTVGSDIVFAAGQFAPQTRRGARLLAHELTHVVQQSHADSGAAPAGIVQRQPVSPGTAAGSKQKPAVPPAAPDTQLPTCQATAVADWIKDPQNPKGELFGLTQLSGGGASPGLRTTPAGSSKGFVVLPTSAALARPIEISYLQPGRYPEHAIRLRPQEGGGPPGGYLRVWEVTDEGSKAIRAGEQEHCDDLRLAYYFSFYRYAEVVNQIAAQKTLFPTEAAARDALKGKVFIDAKMLPAYFRCLADNMRDQRDQRNTGWHTPRKSEPTLGYDAKLRDNVAVRTLTAKSLPEVGKHPSETLLFQHAAPACLGLTTLPQATP